MTTDPDSTTRCTCGTEVQIVGAGAMTQVLEVVQEGDARAAEGAFTWYGAPSAFPVYLLAAAPGDPWPRLIAHRCAGAADVAGRTVTVREHTRVMPHSRPVARTTDPGTSHAAARSVKQPRTLRARLLGIFAAARKPLTDEDLIRRHHQVFPDQPATDSGIRSRRSELVRAGLLAPVDEKGRTASGRACWRYGVTKAGMQAHSSG